MRAVRPAIFALGATQVIGYGTCYYAYSILAPAVAREFGVPLEILFAIFSVALLLGGLASPLLGILMDRVGAARLMAFGSLCAAIVLAGIAVSPGIYVFALLTVALEIVGALILYNAAFAALAQLDGAKARRAITYLTLIAGFASTLFWPLTGWLLASVGWRATYFGFALLHLVVALPVHAWLSRFATARKTAALAQTGSVPPPHAGSLGGFEGRIAFVAVAVSFALSNLVAASFAVHLVSILQTVGLGASAYAVAMVMGPAQVFVRLTDAVFWKGLHPLTVAVIGATSLPLSALCLLLGQPHIGAAIAFAALFGFGQGLESIVAGTVPLALFDRTRYGELLGKLSAARLVLGAGAPFAFAALTGFGGLNSALLVLITAGTVAILPLLVLRARLKSTGRLHTLPAI
jgi:MFS family permease